MKYYGKEKCRILKQIRAEIAKNNDIEWIVEECEHKGNCLGTCPKCEAEVRELERKLEERKNLGKTVAVVGVAAGIALSVSGCGLLNPAGGKPAADETTAEQSLIVETTEGVTETESETETETGTETEEESFDLLGDIDVIEVDETFDQQNFMGKMTVAPIIKTDTDTDNNG